MSEFTNMILFLLVLFTTVSEILCIAPPCCGSITNPSCKQACLQMETTGNHQDQMEQLIAASKMCSGDQLKFWQCINSSLPVVHAVSVWSGRPCCNLAVNRYCEQACREGKSISDIQDKCTKSLEVKLYACIHKQQDGESCCQIAQEYNCRLVCQGTFLFDYTRKIQRQILRGQCTSSHSIMQCFQNQVRSLRESNTRDRLPCCYQLKSQVCQDTCINALTTMTNEQEIGRELVKSCGHILPQLPPWKCFLQRDTKDPVQPLDGAGLQCCAQAKNQRCKKLCSQTYNSELNKQYTDFRDKCQDMTSPVSRVEAPMLTCITEVEEPCKLGCEKLQYCTNFNNRPTDLFRACNQNADMLAEREFHKWVKDKHITLQIHQMQIPVKDIRTCEPELWKSIACATHIKPCSKLPSSLFICRDDCLYILNKCLNRSSIHPDQTVSKLCKILSSDENSGSCISIRKFASENANTAAKKEVTTPCNPSPCDEKEICWINRGKCRHSSGCRPYVCHRACSMGSMSTMKVPRHTYVRVPIYQENPIDSDCVNYQVCQCGKHNKLDNCKPLPCIHRKKCMLGTSQSDSLVKNHGEHFRIDCNYCICNSGELICTKRRCPPDKIADKNSLTGLSCDCTLHYTPHCGVNGKTYPNECLAKRCGGLKPREITHGTCRSVNPCADNPCLDDFRCLPKRQVCLNKRAEKCIQYECVPLNSQCDHHHHDPVCSTTGEEFANSCLLFKRHHSLAYRGHCQENCFTSFPVCGHNGETYTSECEALADRVTVDYHGECRAVGHFSGNLTSSDCTHIKCPPVLPKQCKPITPPGGCCPICAAELRALFKPDLADIVAQTTTSGPVTVHGILEILSHMLAVAECDVFGYLNVESADLVILVTPVVKSPSMLQVKACVKEAEKIEYLIQIDSPLLKSFMRLTPLLLTPLRTPGSLVLSGATVTMPSLTLIFLSVLFVFTRTCPNS